MALFEVEVKQVSTVYYSVEAKDAEAARTGWSRENYLSEFVDTEEVVNVIAEDDRFDDEVSFEDSYDYEDEELADDDYLLSSN